ncbi:MAG: DUF5941 domain-containing protein [Carbonactinosporaceae bacterium]
MSALEVYRDDGPLAVLVGRRLGGVPGGALALTLLASLPLVAALGVALAGTAQAATRVSVGLAVVWFVIIAGAASGASHSGRFVWLVPPLLRACEYGFLLGVTVLAGAPVWACYGLVAVLAFHHYDTVYRLRIQGTTPPGWVRTTTGGWDTRMLVAYLLLLAGVLGAGLVVATGAFGVIFVTESTVGWLRFRPAGPPALYDEEDEDA